MNIFLAMRKEKESPDSDGWRFDQEFSSTRLTTRSATGLANKVLEINKDYWLGLVIYPNSVSILSVDSNQMTAMKDRDLSIPQGAKPVCLKMVTAKFVG